MFFDMFQAFCLKICNYFENLMTALIGVGLGLHVVEIVAGVLSKEVMLRLVLDVENPKLFQGLNDEPLIFFRQ
jgi:hypothetical protein